MVDTLDDRIDYTYNTAYTCNTDYTYNTAPLVASKSSAPPQAPAIQVSKSIADRLMMEKYGILPGCLKKAFTGKSKSQSFNVQVLSVRSRCIQVSDGQHTILNCIAYCDINNIISATNPIIRISQWSLIQMTRTAVSSSNSNEKPEYGMRLDRFSVIEVAQPLPVIGKPKLIKVTIFKEPKVQVESIIIYYLNHLNVASANPASESVQQWVRNIHQVMRKADAGWSCGICGVFLSPNITANAISHIQRHYRDFPGYKCPKFECLTPTLQAFQEHANLQLCQQMAVSTSKELKEQETEAPLFDMNVYESPVKNIEALGKFKEANNKEVCSNILNSLDSHFLSSSSFDDLWNDLALQKNVIHAKVLPKNDQIKSQQENKLKSVHESNEDHKWEGVLKKSSKMPRLSSNLNNSQPFNWQEELTNMLAEHSSSVNDKKVSLEENDPIPKSESSNRNNDDFALEEGEIRRRPPPTVIASNSYSSKQSTWEKDLKNMLAMTESFNWHEEMEKRVKMKGKKYICIECGYKNEGHTSIIRHLETFHMKNIISYKCPECSITCDTFLTFNEHMKLAHKVKLTLQREIVEEKSDEETSFALINQSIQGLFASELFIWKDEMKARIKQGTMFFECEECGFKTTPTWTGRKTLLSHIESCHLTNIAGYKCPHCDLVSHTFVSFNQHISFSHKVFLKVLQNSSLFL